MNETVKAILGVLEEGSLELKIAAAQILGELRPKDAAVTQSLGSCLNHADSYLTRYLLSALSHIGNPAAIRVLVSRLDEPGPNADLVAHMLREIGVKAGPTVAGAFEDAGPEARNRILGILSSMPCAEGIELVEDMLLVPACTKRASDVLLGSFAGEMDEKQQKSLKDRLSKAISKQGDLDPQCLAQVLMVLGRIDGKGARATLVKYTGPDNPSMVRQAALSALDGVHLTPVQANGLLEYLTEQDFTNVIEPTVKVLEQVDSWNEKSAAVLKKLLSSRREALKLFAVRAMRHIPSAEVVKQLVNQLLGPSAAIREVASASLAANKHALLPLFKSFSNEKKVEQAMLLSQPLETLGLEMSGAQVKSLADKAVRHLIQKEAMGEVQLDLLVGVKREESCSYLVDKAVRYRKARKIPEALVILLFLAQRKVLDAEGSYQLALLRLMLDLQEGRSEELQPGDATMGYFVSLVRDGFPLMARLTRESVLTPESLLRIGAHFSSGVGSERRFGSEMLHHVADKHGRQRAGEDALDALRAEGL